MGRPAVVPPAGRVWGGAPLPGRWGREGRWGAFSESTEEGAAGSEIGALPGGRRVRWGWPEDSIPIGRRQPVWRSESYLGHAGSAPPASVRT